MSVLSYNELVELVESGVIDAKPEHINAASIDITLGSELLVETVPSDAHKLQVDLASKQTLHMALKDHTLLFPNQFVLGHSQETFNLPNNIAAEYKLKSSLARSGLEHLNAGWCDPGWSGQLTLELKNVCEWHTLHLTPGMKVGQMIFYKVSAVPEHASYKTKGQYNDQRGVQQSKGVK